MRLVKFVNNNGSLVACIMNAWALHLYKVNLINWNASLLYHEKYGEKVSILKGNNDNMRENLPVLYLAGNGCCLKCN